MIGKTLAHFRILKKLRSGGMGDVYLAEDTQLDRPATWQSRCFRLGLSRIRSGFADSCSGTTAAAG
jgi:serine/threonine protein kinase